MKILGIHIPFTKNKNKENKMSEYQGKSALDYKKVTDAFNKVKSSKSKNFDSLKSNLINLSKSFNALEKDKKQEELKSEKFQKLDKDIKSLNNDEFNKIMNSMDEQRELSDFEKLSKQIESLTNKLDTIEKENLKIQGSNIDDIGYSTENIAKIINESFWDTLKQLIPKLDLTPISKKIDDIKKELSFYKNNADNSNRALAKKIDNIKIPSIPTPPKIPTDYLKKDDFDFTINEKLKDLKEIKESSDYLQTVPTKVISIEKKVEIISEKLDNLPSSNASQTPKHIPKEEKSVIELAKYMTDGVAQFENIAKEYISKIGELENLEKIKSKHKEELEKSKKDALEDGKRIGKIELIKNLAENFPTEFKVIQSTFEELLEYKFNKDNILEITDDNKNENINFIEGTIEDGKYKVVSPAILLDKKILIKATLEKIIDSKSENEKVE